MPRRSVLLALLAAPLTVAACSDDKPKPAGSSTATTSATAAPPKVTGAGLPADLLSVLTALYLGGTVSTIPSVGAVLGKRKTRTTAVKVTGSTGTWKGSPIATVVQGNDVTLLVKDKTWKVVGGWWPSLSVSRAAFPTMRVLAIGDPCQVPVEPATFREAVRGFRLPRTAPTLAVVTDTRPPRYRADIAESRSAGRPAPVTFGGAAVALLVVDDGVVALLDVAGLGLSPEQAATVRGAATSPKRRVRRGREDSDTRSNVCRGPLTMRNGPRCAATGSQWAYRRRRGGGRTTRWPGPSGPGHLVPSLVGPSGYFTE
jgi:hypothetical protein